MKKTILSKNLIIKKINAKKNLKVHSLSESRGDTVSDMHKRRTEILVSNIGLSCICTTERGLHLCHLCL